MMGQGMQPGLFLLQVSHCDKGMCKLEWAQLL